MIADYTGVLSLFDFGKRVKAMFKFIPIENMDEVGESFFGGKWEESGEEGAFMGKGEKTRHKETDFDGKNGRFGAEGVSAVMTEMNPDNRKERIAGEISGFGGKLDFGQGKERFEDRGKGFGREESAERDNRAAEGRVYFRDGKPERSGADSETMSLFGENGYSERKIGSLAFSEKKKTEENDMSFFLEDIQSDGEGYHSSGKSGEKLLQEISSEQMILPVLARIESSTERIEQTMRQNFEREELSVFAEDNFRERLEEVLRGEILRNGF